MPDFLDECREEILAAKKAYRLEQLEGFLCMEPDLCGVPVLPLTPRMVLELEVAGNSFCYSDQEVTAEDVVQFVHRISRDFKRGDLEQVKHIALTIFTSRAGEAVRAYQERSHSACPTSKGDSKDIVLSDACWLAFLVDQLAARYGWSVDVVLDTPYRVIWQLFQQIIAARDSDYTQRAPAIAEISKKYMERKLEQIRAEEALKYGK